MIKSIVMAIAPRIIRVLRDAGVFEELAERVVERLTAETEDERAYVSAVSKRLIEKVKASNYYIAVVAILNVLSEESEIIRRVLESLVDLSDDDGFTMEEASRMVLDLAEQLVPAETYNKLMDTVYSLKR